MRLLTDIFQSMPNIACTIKDAKGRIIFTNDFNVDISGWECVEDMLGYTSMELYPPDQAAVYGNRDREVFETGIPIIDRIYGFVADRSKELNCVSIRPIEGNNGIRIGTITTYYRAQSRMKITNWYDPIRKAIAYLNDHLSENISLEKLATISHYSVPHFRKLFIKLTQMTPSDYIMKTRINAARTLLLTTDRLIVDIAADTGFYDHAHFIHAFHKATGKTPAVFRREHAL